MRTEQEKKFPAHVELKPDRNLLDPNFNGYKLSLEKLPTYVVSIKTGVDRAKPTEQQYSLQHVQQFAVHNHIFSDPFNPFVVYIVDKMWTILRGSIDFSTGRLDVISELWRVPKPRPLKEGRFNITMSFPDDNHAVVSDGCETIYILKTGDRKSSEPWNPVNTLTPFKGKTTPQCCILDSAKYKIGGDTFIDVLAVRIDDKNEWNEVVEKLPSLSGHLFLTVLEWFTFQGEGVEETKWTLKSQRTLLGHSGTKYAYLEQSGSGIVIASESLFHVVVDTEKPIDWNAFLPKNKPTNNDKKVEYVWTQTMEEVKLWFKVPFSINKKDVEVDFKRESISVSYKHRPIFEGPLTKPLKIEGSYWIIETPKSLPENTPNLEMTEDDENCTDSSKYKVLEVVLEKEQEGDVWAEEVVKGNADGQEVSDPEFLKEIYSRLAHLCSDKWGADTGPSDIYDPRQLEECDEYPADSSCLIRVDRSLQKISHTASLGSHQWLFNVRSAPSQPPAICIRHDVDGIVWMPRLLSLSNPEEGTVAGSSSDQISKNITWKCEHIGTFSALGYVQASKQQRKFTLCSSDISYVAICDVKKHIYVYRQPAKIETCLRNRKTGEHVTHVAKQLVISLDPAEDILGAYATPSYLYVLTPENFHAIRILAEEE